MTSPGPAGEQANRQTAEGQPPGRPGGLGLRWLLALAAEGPKRSEGVSQPEPRRPFQEESGPRTDEHREDGRGPEPCLFPSSCCKKPLPADSQDAKKLTSLASFS